MVVQIPDLVVSIMVTSECDVNEASVELVDDIAHKLLIAFPFNCTLNSLDGIIEKEDGIINLITCQVTVDTAKTAIDHSGVNQSDRRHLGVGGVGC